MQLQNFLVPAVCLFTAASAASLGHASLHARQVPSKPCSHLTGGVHVIATPGEGTSNPPYGLLITLATMILQRIPGSTNVSVPYDHTQTNGVIQSQQAAQNLTNYITEYHNSCPNTKIVLLGYSSGAIATMNVLCGESSPPYSFATSPLSTATYGSSIIANVVYGDETRTAGNTWDFGTCTNNGSHPRQNPAGCDAWANKIRSYCDTADPLCCAGGTDMQAHYNYPTEYDKTAADFVMRRLAKAGGA